MAAGFDNVVSRMGGMSIVDHPPPLCASRDQLHQTNQELMRAAEETIKQVQRVQTIIKSDKLFVSQDVAALSSLRRKATELADIAHIVSSELEDCIVAHITSLGDRNPDLRHLLTHFEKDFKKIIQKVLNDTTDNIAAPWRVLEECYNQSASNSGTLHSDNYFIPLEEAALESPYDPDFESEEYYEHENRLEIDESYAEAERMRREQVTERKRRTNRNWIKFWVDALAQCPGGPTLFWPPAEYDLVNNPADVPQYLFRTFDSKSSGKSDDAIVASAASIYGRPDLSKTDLLSLERKEASQKLVAHLTKDCFGGDGADNLMSWSSSFLFVVQYAIWRCHKRSSSKASIKICAVDTTKFPRGQFARDNWLIQACYRMSDRYQKMDDLIGLRKKGYDNGEYLSQGTVYHKDRSCVFSLESLTNAGLFELYPELNEPEGRKLWTNRVKELRKLWAKEQATASREVQGALHIARTCFPKFQAFDIALLLLTFKERITSATPTEDPLSCSRRYNEYGPEDVQRYYREVQSFKLQNEHNWFARDSQFGFFPSITLEKFFNCTDTL